MLDYFTVRRFKLEAWPNGDLIKSYCEIDQELRIKNSSFIDEELEQWKEYLNEEIKRKYPNLPRQKITVTDMGLVKIRCA